MQGLLSRLRGHAAAEGRSASARGLVRRGGSALRSAVLVGGLAALALPACRAQKTQDTGNDAPPMPKPGKVKILYPSAPGSFVRTVARLRPSLVNLHSPTAVAGGPATELPPRRGADDPFYAASPLRDRVEKSLGTGVILNRRGYVLTALRVLRHAAEVRARLHDGRILKTTLVGRDEDTGVAVLKLQLPTTGKPIALTPAPYGDSAQLRPGDWVLAAGDPFGAAPFVSAGLVSAAGAPKGMTLSRPGYWSFVMTDARISTANQGGPLVNASGEVVGINVLLGERERPLGFAVPINMIREVLPTLLKHGRVTRSWVGIYVKPVSERHAKTVGLDKARGALVSEVVAGGPAAQAGLKAGDIILQFDGKPVNRHQDLPFTAARLPSGKTVLVKIWRDRALHVLSLRVERKPE